LPEGLDAAEVGKEIAEHQAHKAGEADGDRRDRWISILEAAMLSFVAVLAAYSGYAAAKWGTESSISLAKASAIRTKASRIGERSEQQMLDLDCAVPHVAGLMSSVDDHFTRLLCKHLEQGVSMQRAADLGQLPPVCAEVARWLGAFRPAPTARGRQHALHGRRCAVAVGRS
jgi:hypothetical protein